MRPGGFRVLLVHRREDPRLMNATSRTTSKLTLQFCRCPECPDGGDALPQQIIGIASPIRSCKGQGQACALCSEIIGFGKVLSFAINARLRAAPSEVDPGGGEGSESPPFAPSRYPPEGLYQTIRLLRTLPQFFFFFTAYIANDF